MESGSEEEDDGDGQVRRDGASEYEKERLSRIAENRARMEALGLRRMASSLTTMMGSSSQARRQSSRNRKGKAKVDEDDDDYRPEDERPPNSSGEEEEEDSDFSNEDDDGNGDRKSNSKRKVKTPKKKKKNKMTVPKSRKKVSIRKVSSHSDYIDDDEALKRAIALSLQESGVSERSDKVSANETKGMNQSKGDSGKNKRQNSFASRLQMTEDELILYFYQFDENWNDGISVRDLERVANEHDFTWSDKDLAEMIHGFDSNGDGKLSLDDFRKIAMRCKMIKGILHR